MCGSFWEIIGAFVEATSGDKALEMLRGLKTIEDEQYLDDVAAQYQKRFARYPASTRDLRDVRLIPGIPVDVDGFPYVFGPDGKSRLNPQSTVVIPKDLTTQPTARN